MTLVELKYVLDQMYGFDISEITRARKKVYAKKVFVNLSFSFGYGWTEIGKEINLTHANCIHHHKTFGDIKPIDLMMYNACIDYFNLPMQKIPTVESIYGSPTLDKVLYNINSLSRKDLKYFNDKVLIPFLKRLEQEKSLLKSIKNHGN